MVLVDDIQHEGEKHYYQTKKKKKKNPKPQNSRCRILFDVILIW